MAIGILKISPFLLGFFEDIIETYRKMTHVSHQRNKGHVDGWCPAGTQQEWHLGWAPCGGVLLTAGAVLGKARMAPGGLENLGDFF